MESAETVPLRPAEGARRARPRLGARRGPQLADSVVLGRYRLLHPLGAGGFGVVWLAHDERLDREVAVKRIDAPAGATTPSGRLTARVRREARAAARLSHPTIVAIYEAEADDGALYLVSELVRGRTLAELERDGALSDRDVVAVGVALCDALAHAHARGVIHRDLKPANVIVPDQDADDAVVAAKLTDFGIAQLIGDEALTQTGDVMGTLAYMAPEQADGRRVGAAADLYSLAVVLYEAFSGVNPLRGAGLSSRSRPQRLPSLRRLRRDLPPDLCRALDVAVSTRPDERGTVKQLRGALLSSVNEVEDVEGSVGAAPLESLVARRRTQGFTVATRASASLSAALLAAALLWRLAPAGGPGPAAGAICAAIVVGLLPRLGWLAGVATLVTWMAAAGAAGLALVCGCALIVPPLLLPTTPAAWSLPALAPALGLGGLAGAFPAVAGQARAAVSRAALGAVGLWWLSLAEPALQMRLLLGAPAESRPRAAWDSSGGEAVHRVLAPVLSGRTLALALVWAAAAVALPWLVRGRSLRLDALAGALWATGLAVATVAVADSAAGRTPAALPREAVAAGLLALLAALAGRTRRRAA
ncbi:MAG: eukaryotic-like serine/threonine-protein kinase [Solirubrobacteraceae bacterium]|nr:eukaryotic-like serine/threonine-protein kinase [Solirubrobacteraceae bacterium]